MALPVSERQSKDTLHLSPPEELVRQAREVACRKHRHTSHLCRDFIEAGLQKPVVEDGGAPDAVASVSSAT